MTASKIFRIQLLYQLVGVEWTVGLIEHHNWPWPTFSEDTIEVFRTVAMCPAAAICMYVCMFMCAFENVHVCMCMCSHALVSCICALALASVVLMTTCSSTSGTSGSAPRGCYRG
jgi:hypothetical protein